MKRALIDALLVLSVKVRSYNRRLDEIISEIEGDLRNGG